MKIDVVLDFIRNSSKNGELIEKNMLVEEPLKIEVSKLETVLEEIVKNEEIVKLVGKEKVYYYSTFEMADNYANILFNKLEDNKYKMFVDFIRNESKVYPRPTPIETFKYNPFSKTEEEAENILSEIYKLEEFSDIKEVFASNGAMYLYSDKFMTFPHAKALCEWVEVEQFRNP